MAMRHNTLSRRTFVKLSALAGVASGLGGIGSRSFAEEQAGASASASGISVASDDGQPSWRDAYRRVLENAVSQYGEPSWAQTRDGFMVATGLSFAALAPMGGSASLQLIVTYWPGTMDASQITNDYDSLVSAASEYITEVWDYDSVSNQAVLSWSGGTTNVTNGGWLVLSLAAGSDGTTYLVSGIEAEFGGDRVFYAFANGTCGIVHELASSRDPQAQGLVTYAIDGIEVDAETYRAVEGQICCDQADWALGRSAAPGLRNPLAPLMAQHTRAILSDASGSGDPLQGIRDEWAAASESGWQTVPDESSIACLPLAEMNLLVTGQDRPRPGWEDAASWVAWGVVVPMGADAEDALVIGVGPRDGSPRIAGIYCVSEGVAEDLTNGSVVNSSGDAPWGVIDADGGSCLFWKDSWQGTTTYDHVGGRIIPATYSSGPSGGEASADGVVLKNGAPVDAGEYAALQAAISNPPALPWEQLGQAAGRTSATYAWTTITNDQGNDAYPVISSPNADDAAVASINAAILQDHDDWSVQPEKGNLTAEARFIEMNVALFQNGFVSVLERRVRSRFAGGGTRSTMSDWYLSRTFDVRTGQEVGPWAVVGLDEQSFADAAEQAISNAMAGTDGSGGGADAYALESVAGNVAVLMHDGDEETPSSAACVPTSEGLDLAFKGSGRWLCLRVTDPSGLLAPDAGEEVDLLVPPVSVPVSMTL